MSEVNLPEGWALSSLAKSVSVDGIISDGDWIESKDQDPNGSVRLIQLADIGDGDFRNKSERFMTPESAAALNCTFLKSGDVLIARMPDPLGRACLFPGVGQEAVTVVDVCLIRTGEKAAISNKLLSYWINSPVIRNLIAANASGTTRKRITRKKLEQFDLPLPPLAEQKVIADKLDTLLAQVETTKARLDRIPQILKTFRQSVLAAAMSGKLTEAWREKNDASAWQQKILGDVVTGISQGWSPKCLSEGTSDTSWGVIKTSSVQEIQFLEQENKKLPDNLEPREALKVEVGDILTTRAGPRSRCGVTCYVGNLSLNLMICDKVYRYKAKTEIGHSKFLVMQLNSHPTLENIESLKTGISESGMNLTQKKFKALPLKWPSKEEQTQIVSRVEELFAFAERIEQKANAALERVNNLAQSILAKAFRGELTADWRTANPDLITGENSAEALLAKIKVEREANKSTSKGKRKLTRKAKPKKEIQSKILLENPVVGVLNKKGIAKPQAIFDELKELMDLREVLKEISQLLEQQVIKEIDKDGQQYLEINR